MPRIQAIYHQLQGIRDPTVDRAMAAALPTADRLAVRLIALRLLQRRHPEGLLGLILHYHTLPREVRQQVVEHVDDLFRALREATARPGTAGPANAIEVIRRALRPRLAYLVTDQLRHGIADVQRMAAEALLHLAEHAATDPHPGVLPQIDAAGGAYLQSGLDEAVRAFGQHRQETALLAAAWMLPRPIPGVLAPLSQEQHPALEPMRSLLRQASYPAVRRALPALLSVRPLTEACLEGLRQCAATGTLADVWSQHHLLRLPAPGRLLARLGTPEAACPDDDAIASLDPIERRALPTWYALLPLERSERIQRLAHLRHDADTATRLFALRRLLELAAAGPGEGVQDVIALFCEDPDLVVARIALHHLVRSQYEGLSRLLTKLVNSPHEPLRRIAGRRLGPIGFEKLWEAWPKLEAGRRLAVGRALIKIDPRFHQLLGDRLRSPDQATKLRALSIIHGLNQGTFFESALSALAQEQDEVVASAAVKALGPVGSELAVCVLEQSLEHEDSRVRANAVEALSEAQSTQQVVKLMEMAHEEANRPRANAIQTLLSMKTGEALPALVRMLADTRPKHRASALWLVESMGLLEVARQVAEMSISDPDADIRSRADRVIHELIELMDPPDTHAPQATAPGPEAEQA